MSYIIVSASMVTRATEPSIGVFKELAPFKTALNFLYAVWNEKRYMWSAGAQKRLLIY